MWVIVKDIVIEDFRRLVRRVLRRPDPPLPYASRSPRPDAPEAQEPSATDDRRAS